MPKIIRRSQKFLKYFFRKHIGYFIHPIFKKEGWIPLKDTNYYLISNKGRIISLPHYKSPYYNFLNPRLTREGYLTVKISKKNYILHRLVAEHFIPNPDKLETVNHKNFKKWDNSMWNLEWMSNIDNVNHAILGGRMKSNGGSHKVIRPIEARICSRCSEMKPMDEFYEGYSWCKSCQKGKNAKYYLDNREKFVQNKYNSKYS